VIHIYLCVSSVRPRKGKGGGEGRVDGHTKKAAAASPTPTPMNDMVSAFISWRVVRFDIRLREEGR
jgi:hypothetical protein